MRNLEPSLRVRPVAGALPAVLALFAACALGAEHHVDEFNDPELHVAWHIRKSPASKAELSTVRGQLHVKLERGRFLLLDRQNFVDGTDKAPLIAQIAIRGKAEPLKSHPPRIYMYWDDKNFVGIGCREYSRNDTRVSAAWRLGDQTGSKEHYGGVRYGNFQWFRIVLCSRAILLETSHDGVRWWTYQSLERHSNQTGGPPSRIMVGKGWTDPHNDQYKKPALANDHYHDKSATLYNLYMDHFLLSNRYTGALALKPEIAKELPWNDAEEIANRDGFIRRWWIIGPFDNANDRGRGKAYPPEKKIDGRESYKGKGGKEVSWVRHDFEDDFDGTIDLKEVMSSGDWGVAYLYGRIKTDREGPALLSMDGDDYIVCWVNGKKVVDRNNYANSYYKERHRTGVWLRKGRNHVLLKVSQRYGPWRVHFRHEPAHPAVRMAKLRALVDAFPLDTFHRKEACLEIARIQEHACDFGRAVETLDELANQSAGDRQGLLEARYEQARIYRRLGDYESSARVLTHLAKECSSDIATGFSARSEAAMDLARAKKWTEAAAAVDELIASSKTDPARLARAHRTLARFHAMKNDTAARVRAMLKLAELAPSDGAKADLHVAAAEALFGPERDRRLKDPKAKMKAAAVSKALDQYRQAFRLTPARDHKLVKPLRSIAEGLATKKSFMEAAAAYEAAYFRAKIAEIAGEETQLLSESGLRLQTRAGRDWRETERNLNREMGGYGYPRDWYFAGPMDNSFGNAMLKPLAPETSVDLKGTFKDAKGKNVRWQKVTARKRDHFRYPAVRLHEFFGRGLWAAYLYREFDWQDSGQAYLWIGHEDQCIVWLNGKEVYRDLSYGSPVPDRHKVKVDPVKGKNRLLVKINQCDPRYGYSHLYCRVSPHSWASTRVARVEHMSRLHPLNREYLAGWWGEAAMEYIRVRRLDDAWNLLRAFEAAYPDRAEQVGAYYRRLAWSARDKSRQDLMVSAAEKALELLWNHGAKQDYEGAHFDAMRARARGLNELQRVPEAEEAYRELASRHLRRGGNAEPMRRWAEMIWNRRGFQTRSVQLNEQVLRRYPDEWRWLTYAGGAARAIRKEKQQTVGYEISFEAGSLIKTAERSLDRSEIGRAVRLMQSACDAAGQGLYRLGDGRLVGVGEYCRDKVEDLREEGILAYRDLFDSKAKSTLKRARERLDPIALEEVAEQYRFSSSADEALNEAGNIYLDRGRYDRAAGAFERILSIPGSDLDKRMLLAKTTFCLARSGRTQEALEKLSKLGREHGAAQLVIGGVNKKVRSYVSEIRESLNGRNGHRGSSHWTYGRDSRRTNMAPSAPREMKLLWQQTSPSRWEYRIAATRLQPAPFEVEGSYPAVASDTVYSATPDGVEAVSLQNGSVAWKSHPAHPERSKSLGDAGFTGLVVTAPTVYAGRVCSRARWRRPGSDRAFYAVEARDTKTGKLLWSTASIDPTGRMTAITPPAAAYGAVFAAFHMVEEINQLLLAAFDAKTGALLWKTHICSGYPGFKQDNGYINFFYHAGPPSVADGIVYLSTDFGALASVDAFTGKILWVSSYERAIVEPRGRGRQARVELAHRGLNAPIIADRSVFIAPRDTMAVMAFDRRTGRVVWRNESADCRHLLGLSGQTLYVQGKGVQALDAATGAIRWAWQPSGQKSYGMGLLARNEVLFPTTEGIWRLKAADGVVNGFSPWNADAGPCGNLVVAGGALVGSGPGGVSAYGSGTGPGMSPKSLVDSGVRALGEGDAKTALDRLHRAVGVAAGNAEAKRLANWSLAKAKAASGDRSGAAELLSQIASQKEPLKRDEEWSASGLHAAAAISLRLGTKIATPPADVRELAVPLVISWRLPGGKGFVARPDDTPSDRFYAAAGSTLGCYRLATPPEPIWESRIGRGLKHMSFSMEIIAAVFRDHVEAYDRGTGERLWVWTLTPGKGGYNGRYDWDYFDIGYVGVGPKVTTVCQRTGLNVIDNRTGKLKWGRRTSYTMQAPSDDKHVYFYEYSESRYTAVRIFDVETGREKRVWQVPAKYGRHPALFDLAGPRVLLKVGGKLSLWDLKDFSRKWESNVTGDLRNDAGPLLRFVGNRVVVKGYDRQRRNHRLHVFDAGTGKEVHVHKGWGVYDPAGRVYTIKQPDRNIRRLHCVDLKDGKTLYEVDAGGMAGRDWTGTGYVNGKQLVLINTQHGGSRHPGGSEFYNIYGALFDKETGDFLWSGTLPGTGQRTQHWGQIRVPTIIANGRLLYASQDGVWCAEPAGESVEKTMKGVAKAVASPATPDRTRRNHVVALGRHAEPSAQAFSSDRPVRVDGRLDEWGLISPDKMDSFVYWRPLAGRDPAPNPGRWSGPADLSADLYFTWDRDRVYLAINVTDDVVSLPPPGASTYMGDSLRIGIDSRAYRYSAYDVQRGFEFSVAMVDGRTEVFQSVGKVVDRSSPERTIEAKAAMRPGNKGITYEIAIPWELVRPYSGSRPGRETQMGFCIAVYDADGEGLEGALEWGSGLVYAQSPCLFGKATFVDLSPKRIQQYRQVIDMMPDHGHSWTFLSRILSTYRGPEGLVKLRGQLREYISKHPDSRYCAAAVGFLQRALVLRGSVDPIGEAHEFAKQAGASRKELAKLRDYSVTQWAYLDPKDPPSTIMLQFHAYRKDWRRVYWGRNTLDWGINGTLSRLHMGPLPDTGKWVKLEIPAALLGLTETQLDYIAWSYVGGQAFWGPTIVRKGGTVLKIAGEPFPENYRKRGTFKWVGSPSKDGVKSHTAGATRGRANYHVEFERARFHYGEKRPDPTDADKKREFELVKKAAEILNNTREGWDMMYWVESQTSHNDWNQAVKMRVAYYEGLLAKFPDSRNAHSMLERVRELKGKKDDAVAYCESIMRKSRVARREQRLFYARFAPCLTQMMVIGPFDNPGGHRGMIAQYGPERQLNLGAAYLGKPIPPEEEGGDPTPREVRWVPAKFRKDNSGGYVDLRANFGSKDKNILAYATFAVNCPKRRKCLFLFGGDRQIAIWLNGRKIVEPTYTNNRKDDKNAVVTLNKGANRVLLKCGASRYGHWRFYCRIADMNGRPYADLSFERQEFAKRAYSSIMKRYEDGELNAWLARKRLQEVVDNYKETVWANKAKEAIVELKAAMTAKDASGKGHDLQVYGCATELGRFGKALHFDGARSFAEHAKGGGPGPAGNELTLEAWVKLEAEEDTARIILNREERFEIQVGSESGKGRSAFEAALGNQWQWKGGGKVQMGEWTHVAAVWDGKVMRLFVGGKKAAEHDLPDGAPFAAGGGALRVGARGAPNEPSGVFRGLMDELRISSKARYTADFTPPAEPFKPDAATMALWHFDEGKLTKPGPVKLGREPQDGMWLMISGFSNEGAKGFDAAYPPEKVVDLRGRYRLGDGTRARWKLIKSPGSVYDLRTFDERFNIVYYAFAYLRSAADQEATLVTNSDDGIKVWLNGKVIVSENVYRGLDDGGDKRTKVQLKKGLNSVLLKVTQGEGDAAFRCYVEGAKAKVSRTARGPVTGIKE